MISPRPSAMLAPGPIAAIDWNSTRPNPIDRSRCVSEEPAWLALMAVTTSARRIYDVGYIIPMPTMARETRPRPPVTKGDYAYEQLRRRIVTGELAPGTRLDLPVLCETLGVSRMPVRDALSRLDEQGLVEIRPQLATVVSTLSAADLHDTYGARMALESLLIGEAAARVDDKLVAAMGCDIETQRTLADAGDL